MIQKSFFDADGWTCYDQEKHILHPTASHLYQKREMAGNSTLFFWDVWFYPKNRINGHSLKETFCLDVQFTTRDGPFFNIQASEVDTVEKLEDAMGRIRRFYAGENWMTYDD